MQNTPDRSTTREYFYTLDNKGILRHDGSEIQDSAVLRRFFRDLRRNDSGRHPDFPYLSHCGHELNFMQCEDRPFVFTQLENGHLQYTPDMSVDFDPKSLRFGENGVLYHAAPLGEYGRCSAQLTMKVSANIRRWGPWFSYHDAEHDIIEVIEPLVASEDVRLLRPRDGNLCVGCGRDSATGLKLSFLFDAKQNTAQSWFVPDNRLMGSLNIMHGGFVALLLDETMGKVLGANSIKAPTAQLSVRYRAPVPIGEELELFAQVEQIEGRKHRMSGRICRAADSTRVLAEAEALFIRIRTDNGMTVSNVIPG